MMRELLTQLEKTPIAYIARDIERALGFPLGTPGYFIVSNASSFAKETTGESSQTLLVEHDLPLDTEELLRHESTLAFLKRHDIRRIVVFKNTAHIERAAMALGFELLNPPAGMSKIVEEKISQIHWLGELAAYLPPHRIAMCKELAWEGRDFIVQFNHAHTGDGTMRITAKADIEKLQKKFPDRDVRIMDVVNGPTFTNNNIVARDTVLFGNVNYQITGLEPFTDRPFATVGNDWGLAERLLPDAAKAAYAEMVSAIGNRLRKNGWRGLFGIDAMYDEEKKKLYLIEINARQPASATFEAQLQRSSQPSALSSQLTAFEAHLATLLDLPLGDKTLVPIHDGAQIVRRIKKNESGTTRTGEQVNQLKSHGFAVMSYENTQPGEDLLRIQSETTLLSAHNTLNERGELIRRAVS